MLSIIPTPEQAQQYITEAATLNSGPWVQHSYYVAEGAEIIAAHHPQLDPESAYVLGLLHDIGRRYGATGMRHALDGYRFLLDNGFEDAARICLTHSYPIKEHIIGASPWDGSEEEYQFVRAYLARVIYNDYDRLIQLCDAVTLPNGFCIMEKRLVDVAMRYGINEYTIDRWHGFFAVKREIEQAIGSSINRLLPNIVENTFNWHTYSR